MLTAVLMMLVLGAILGLGLGIADRFLSVEVDERVEKVSSMLPNYNCGSCGYAGCSGLAEALVNGEITVVGTCKPVSYTHLILKYVLQFHKRHPLS